MTPNSLECLYINVFGCFEMKIIFKTQTILLVNRGGGCVKIRLSRITTNKKSKGVLCISIEKTASKRTGV